MRLKSPARADDSTASPLEKPTSYRTVGSLVTGAVLVVFGAFFLVSFGFSAEKHPVAAMVGVLMMVCGVVGGIYPAAFSHPEHLSIRNPFRRIDIAWPRIDAITARLSMEIETVAEAGTARKFTIWAIPVSLRDRRKNDRTIAKRTRSTKADAVNQAAGIGGAGYGRPKSAGQDPLEHMAFADQAVAEMRDRQRACTTSVDKAAETSVRWTWYTVGPFAVSVALLLAAIAGAF